MVNKNIFNGIFVSYLALILTGCVNLKTLNNYSIKSVRNIKKFEHLGYSFTKACNDKCEIEQLEKNQLNKRGCECKLERQADSVTRAIYSAIKGYFEGLARLSGNKLTEYKYNALTKALSEGDFGDLTITKEHVDAYAAISGTLTRAVTDSYRKKKLSTYIGNANGAIVIMLNALQFNLVSNLSKKLDVKKERLESYYFDLSRDTIASFYEKKKIIEEYNAALNDIKIKKKQIASFGRGLKRIAEGHQNLNDSRNKLNTKEIKEILTQCASDIQDIVDEFNTIKNEN